MVGSIDPGCEQIRGTHWPNKGRVVDWNSCRGNHLGQRSQNDRINRPDIWTQAIRSYLKKLLCHGGRPHMGPGLRRDDTEEWLKSISAQAIIHSFQWTHLRAPRTIYPGLRNVAPLKQREQGMPGARCTRSLVCKMYKEKRTRVYRFSGSIRHSPRNGFTAYAVLSPATNSSCHRRCRLDGYRSGWIESATGSLAPATGVGTTRFCRTQQRRSSCAP